jgi:hypothetical protein
VTGPSSAGRRLARRSARRLTSSWSLGTLVVTNKSPSTATIIDVASGRILATLPTGKGPHEIAMTSDGGTAVVTDYSGEPGRTLTIIDVARRTVVRTIDLGEYNRPMASYSSRVTASWRSRRKRAATWCWVNIREGAIRRAISTTQKGPTWSRCPGPLGSLIQGTSGATRSRSSTWQVGSSYACGGAGTTRGDRRDARRQ